MSQAYIYALCDPDNGDVRYVGMTLTPDERLQQHLNDKSVLPKSQWIQSLRALGKRPAMTILETCAVNDRFSVEAQWIAEMKQRGASLLNGEHTPQAMAKFRTRLLQLTLDKSTKQGRMITKTEVAKGSQLPLSTIARWYDGEFDRIDATTLFSLMDYFDCKFEDLIERVD